MVANLINTATEEFNICKMINDAGSIEEVLGIAELLADQNIVKRAEIASLRCVSLQEVKISLNQAVAHSFNKMGRKQDAWAERDYIATHTPIPPIKPCRQKSPGVRMPKEYQLFIAMVRFMPSSMVDKFGYDTWADFGCENSQYINGRSDVRSILLNIVFILTLIKACALYFYLKINVK